MYVPSVVPSPLWSVKVTSTATACGLYAPALEREPLVGIPPDARPMKTAYIFAEVRGRAGTSVPKAGEGGSGVDTCDEAVTGPEVVGQETSIAP